jgi:hypothetical protein
VRFPETQSLVSLLTGLARDGCTRFGSPGIFGVPNA